MASTAISAQGTIVQIATAVAVGSLVLGSAVLGAAAALALAVSANVFTPPAIRRAIGVGAVARIAAGAVVCQAEVIQERVDLGVL